MIVYLVRNLSKEFSIKFSPFIEKEKIFSDREKAIKQYKEWAPSDSFGSDAFGIAEKVGSRSMSMAGDKGADIMQMEVIE